VTESLIVEKNFSKAAEYYHFNASAQKFAAKTVHLIAERRIKYPKAEISILEIGCGTGFLTSHLFKSFHNADFSIMDISSEMLDNCKKNTAEIRDELNIKAKFYKLDAEKHLPNQNFDLIVSSLTFQWIENLQKFMIKIGKLLNHKGVLAFSTLREGTFAQLKNVFDNENFIYPGPAMHSVEYIVKSCKFLDNLNFVEESFIETFDSPIECLRHIQKTGAGNASGQYMKTGQLKKIILNLTKPFELEYKMLFVSAEKTVDS